MTETEIGTGTKETESVTWNVTENAGKGENVNEREIETDVIIDR